MTNFTLSFCCTLFTAATMVAAQTTAPTAPAPSPPDPGTGARPAGYSVVSWNENWSFLSDPTRRSDFFDPIKFMPFNESGSVYLSLGGQFRERYEYFNNNNFGAGPQTEDGYYLHRFLAHADLHVGPYFRAFVEGISALMDHRNGGPRATDSDVFDLAQGFVDFSLPFVQRDSVTLRAGRQDLIYGAQRLISPLDWVNTRRTFDGVKMSLETRQNTLDAFLVRPVIVNDTHPDPDDAHTYFAGIYDTLKLPAVLHGAGTTLELYLLSLDKTSRPALATSPATTVGSDTYTVGARFASVPKPFQIDVESDYQFGRSGAGTISAWSIAIEGGYTFEQAPLAPRTYLGFDAASGDRNPKNPDKQTFNQLFPLGHAYFGYIDAIGRQNIIDLHPGAELLLAKNRDFCQRLSLRGDFHLFWRQSTNDAVYNAAGGVLRASAGNVNHDAPIGNELDVLLNWQVDTHLSAYMGYSHFFAGDFIVHTGAHSDIDFAYAAVQYTF